MLGWFTGNDKRKAAGAKSSSRQKKAASGPGSFIRRAAEPDIQPFAGKDPTRLDVLIRSHEGPGGTDSRVLEAFKKDLDEQKASISNEVVHREIFTRTLTLPGYQLMALPPYFSFSRMRNHKADMWRDQAYKNADAFVYPVEIKNADDYLEQGQNKNWELDRYEVSRLLRDVVGCPKKPLLLLVLNNNEDAELDIERLANLLGLGGNSLGRPFRAVMHSSEDSTQNGDLKEALDWLAKTAQSKDDEATAMTGDETDEEASVGSLSTSGTAMFASGEGGHYVLDYEPTFLGGNPTLQRFEPVKNQTYCPFARAAKLWGGKLANEHKPRLAARSIDPLQEAATLNAGPLAEFVARSNNGETLDGFCLEIPGADYYVSAERNVERLGKKVRGLLLKLAELDPASGENCMKMGPINHPHWRFRFSGEDFFLTTFSSAYPTTSSRHAFGAKKSFLLFQPLTSFARHGLVEDTPASATKWTNPVTMRDKARVAFKENGCPYHIPEELPYPVAEHVVKPMVDNGTFCMHWWEPEEHKK